MIGFAKTYQLTAASVALVLLATGAAVAHERIIMGTIAAVHEQTIDVKVKPGDGGQDQEVVSVILDDATRYLKGRESASRNDLASGLRVVVTVDHRSDESLVAKEIRLAPDERRDSTGRDR